MSVGLSGRLVQESADSNLKIAQEQTGSKASPPQTDFGYRDRSLLLEKDHAAFQQYFKSNWRSEERTDERLLCRRVLENPPSNAQPCPEARLCSARSESLKDAFPKAVYAGEGIKLRRMQNHLPNNYVLGNKKTLFAALTLYHRLRGSDVFQVIPKTFHVKDLEDENYYRFLKEFRARGRTGAKNVWIVKPGENSNRGRGITVCLTLEEVKAVVRRRETHADGTAKTYILQAYIERPLLFHGRKIDLRHYALATCVNAQVKGYWYAEGYVRTASADYSLAHGKAGAHLTNDAVQKYLPNYGKFEKGNKLSYAELSEYIDRLRRKPPNHFYDGILPRMKHIATEALRAASAAFDPLRHHDNFELFGLDFMLDEDLNVFLIEVNTNPCLETSCPLLGAIIPRLIENLFEFRCLHRITLDAAFPPPLRFSPKGMHYERRLEDWNQFSLVFDERVEPVFEAALQLLDDKLREDEEETFEDDGEWEDD